MDTINMIFHILLTHRQTKTNKFILKKSNTIQYKKYTVNKYKRSKTWTTRIHKKKMHDFRRSGYYKN